MKDQHSPGGQGASFLRVHVLAMRGKMSLWLVLLALMASCALSDAQLELMPGANATLQERCNFMKNMFLPSCSPSLVDVIALPMGIMDSERLRCPLQRCFLLPIIVAESNALEACMAVFSRTCRAGRDCCNGTMADALDHIQSWGDPGLDNALDSTYASITNSTIVHVERNTFSAPGSTVAVFDMGLTSSKIPVPPIYTIMSMAYAIVLDRIPAKPIRVSMQSSQFISSGKFLMREHLAVSMQEGCGRVYTPTAIVPAVFYYDVHSGSWISVTQGHSWNEATRRVEATIDPAIFAQNDRVVFLQILSGVPLERVRDSQYSVPATAFLRLSDYQDLFKFNSYMREDPARACIFPFPTNSSEVQGLRRQGFKPLGLPLVIEVRKQGAAEMTAWVPGPNKDAVFARIAEAQASMGGSGGGRALLQQQQQQPLSLESDDTWLPEVVMQMYYNRSDCVWRRASNCSYNATEKAFKCPVVLSDKAFSSPVNSSEGQGVRVMIINCLDTEKLSEIVKKTVDDMLKALNNQAVAKKDQNQTVVEAKKNQDDVPAFVAVLVVLLVVITGAGIFLCLFNRNYSHRSTIYNNTTVVSGIHFKNDALAGDNGVNMMPPKMARFPMMQQQQPGGHSYVRVPVLEADVGTFLQQRSDRSSMRAVC